MKKIFALTAIFALVLAGCGKEEAEIETTLIVSNNSSQKLYNVRWNGENMTGGGQLVTGSKTTGKVKPGTEYIFFNIVGVSGLWRTQEIVTIEKGEEKTFNFLNSTIVVNTSNNQTCTLFDLK